MLVAISAIDLERYMIPNRIVLPSAAIVLVAQTALDPSPEWVLAGLGAAAFFFLAALAYPGGMGMGDVKLALLLGFMLGRTVPIAIFVGHDRRARALGRPARAPRHGGAEDARSRSGRSSRSAASSRSSRATGSSTRTWG